MKPEPLGVVGAGCVGLVTAACFAELGHRVTVHDIHAERVESLRAGRPPVHEPGLADALARNRRRLSYTVEIENVLNSAEIVFVCVGTPPAPSGGADLSGLWDVISGLDGLKRSIVLALRSTVPVGTGELVRRYLDARGLRHVGFVSNPEFFSEGTALFDFSTPDRVVIGDFSRVDGDRVAALYEAFDAPIMRTDVASAEMVKLGSNAALVTRISFINEIANVCELIGADIQEVARGIGLDKRIGPHFLQAGVGFGGSCFAKDTAMLTHLAADSGYDFRLMSAVIDVNERQILRVVEKLRDHLGTLCGRTVALLGLAFKADTDDVRHSPTLALAPRLTAEGADVRIWDPVAVEEEPTLGEGYPLFRSLLAAVDHADAAVVVTDWPELRSLPSIQVREAMRTPLIVDGRNVIDPLLARAEGFAYEGIGRPTATSRLLPTEELAHERGASV